MGISANTWVLRGKVFLWRYRKNSKNYPGWDCTADRVGCLALIELFGALAGQSAAVSRTIPVTAPTSGILAVPNNQGGAAPWWSPKKWRISYDPNSEAADTWAFPPDVDPAVLSIGASAIPYLTRGVTDAMNGTGDYSIGPRTGNPETSTQLWFWWQVHDRTSGDK
jgi:hypothetical protein